MSDLFFYGTLRHVPLLEQLLGRPAEALELVEAHLPDHGVFWVAGEPFPMIEAAPGAQAKGLVLRHVSAEDLSRLTFYEGGFAYDLMPLTAIDGQGVEIPVSAFFPEPGLWPKGAPWSLAKWEAAWSQLSLRAAQEAMQYFGHWDAAQLARWMPSIRRRAAAALAAAERASDDANAARLEAVRLHSHTRVHSAFFALDHLEISHPLYAGGQSEVLDRECFYVGDAVSVLPYDPKQDAVLLTEQFRPNIYMNGDPSPWVIEPVSGLVDPGEVPDATARREALEEAGVTLTRLELVSQSYSSTGSSTEFVTGYIGLADFTALGTGGGLDNEGEDIRRILMPYREFADGIRSQRFRDMPLVTLGLWLMLNHERLRSEA